MVDTGEGQRSSAWECRYSLERLEEGRQNILRNAHASVFDLEQNVRGVFRFTLLPNPKRDGTCERREHQHTSTRILRTRRDISLTILGKLDGIRQRVG